MSALVALAVTAVVVIQFWSGASGSQPAFAGTVAAVSLDATSDEANTATSVGTIDGCRTLTSGETAVLDLVIQDVSGLSGFQVDLAYDPAILRVITLTALMEVDYDFLLASTGPSVIDLGDSLPDDGSGVFRLGAAQFPAGAASGSGVLARLRVEAIGSGLASIDLTNPKLSDSTGTPIQPSDASNVYAGPTNSAAIAVDGSCGDFDGDGVPDASDNCPAIANAGQGDWNSDGLGDACQNSDADPAMDDLEVWVGTDPTASCALTPDFNDEPTDGTPYDNNDDQKVTLSDALRYAPWFNSRPGDANWNQRYDISMDSRVSLSDVLRLVAGGWLQSCA